MIEIFLLGPPHVHREGKPIHIQRRAPRALLFYLATENKPISRVHLGELLWHEKMETHQRNSLRYTLTRLRNALQEDNVLHSHLGNLALNPEHVWVDVREFCARYTRAQEILSHWRQTEPLPPQVFEDLREAANLWYGEDFIQSQDMSISLPLEQWRSEIARRLRLARVRMLVQLAAHEHLTGAIENALHWLRESLALDSLDEESHKMMLEILLETGRRSQAQRHYDSMRKTFREELGIDPPEEIRVLAPKIFQASSTKTNGKTKWAVHSTSLIAPFVGQEEALNLLETVYHRGGGVIIRGEAGAGKTRLAQEFYQRLPSPPRLLMLSCYPMEESMPYRPWAEALRKSIAPEEWQYLHHAWAAPLSKLLPEVESLRQIAEFSQSEETYARTATFDAILHLLQTLAQKEPLLLVVDDAQWADEATISVLSHLLKASFFSSQTGMLIITSRLETANPHLTRLALTTDSRILKQISLHGLSQKEIETLARHLLGMPLSAEFIQRLEQDTGGNPFFIVETLREVIARPSQNKFILSDLPIPSSVTRLIQERLRMLPKEALDVLACAAIQGTQFQDSILQKTLSLSEEEVLSAIETLEQASFIRHIENGTYAFIHENIRESLLSELSSARQRALHRAVASALEKEEKNQREKKAAILAQHYEKSGQFSRAFDAWVMAGHYAYRLYSIEDATRAYAHAEQLIAQSNLTDEQIYNLYALWSSMASENDDAETLKKINERLLDIGKARNSPLLVGSAMDGLSDYAIAANRFAEGLDYSTKALRRLRGIGVALAEVPACIHYSILLYMQNLFPKAKECLEEALSLLPPKAESSCVKRLEGQIYHKLSLIYTMMGEPQKGAGYARKCLSSARQSEWAYGSAAAHSMLGLSYYFLGDYDASLDASLRGIELAERIDAWRMLGYLHIYAGSSALEAGFPGDAWKHAQTAQELGHQWGHYEIVSLGQKLISDIYLRLEALHDAIQVIEAGIVSGKESFVTLGLKYRYGYALSLLGDSRGEKYLEEALEKSSESKLRSIWIFAKARQLMTFVHRNDFEAFERNAEEIQQLLSGHFHPESGKLIQYLRAKIEAKKGNLDDALIMNRQLLPIFDEAPKFWIELDVLRLEAFLLETQGKDASEAARHIEKHLQKIEKSLEDIPELRKPFEAFKARRFLPLLL